MCPDHTVVSWVVHEHGNQDTHFIHHAQIDTLRPVGSSRTADRSVLSE